jgi:hypothetical protein
MKRTLFVMAVVLGFATAASAVSLSVVSNAGTYNVGDTITLTVTGDDTGGSPQYSLFGRLLYSGALTDGICGDPIACAAQTAIGTGWITGTTPQIDGETTAFDQLNFNGGVGDALAPGGSPFSTLQLLATAAGVVNVTWRASDLLFFGLDPASAVGTSFTINAVPEPTTAVMLGLGLFGLAIGGRRRS